MRIHPNQFTGARWMLLQAYRLNEWGYEKEAFGVLARLTRQVVYKESPYGKGQSEDTFDEQEEEDEEYYAYYFR